MGYESRLFVVRKTKEVGGNGKTLFSFGEIVADIKMCVMGYEFPTIFKNNIDYDFYLGEELIAEDKYGEPLRAAELPIVIEYIERKITEGDDYRRLKPLLGLLKGFEPEKWNTVQGGCDGVWTESLEVVHYGY